MGTVQSLTTKKIIVFLNKGILELVRRYLEAVLYVGRMSTGRMNVQKREHPRIRSSHSAEVGCTQLGGDGREELVILSVLVQMVYRQIYAAILFIQ